MSTRTGRRLNLAWMVVVAITVVYLAIDHAADADGHPASSTAVTTSAIALGLVKYRVILREFMEVRGAPPILQRLTDALVAVIGVALLTSYLVGLAAA